MEPSKSVQIGDLKVKYNLKEPVIKLQKLSQFILERKTVSASSLLENSHKRNELRKQNDQRGGYQEDEFIDDEVPKQLLAQRSFLQSRIFQGSTTNSQWDSSFFLHMNRYKPEESCFFTPPPSPQQPTHPPPPPPVILSSSPVPPNNKAQSLQPPQISFKHVNVKQKTKPTRAQLLNNKKKRCDVGVRVGGGCWKCNYCPKTFTHKHNMTTHVLMHTGVKPFVCPVCSAQFRQKGHMIRHIAGYHPYQAISTLSVGNVTGSCAFCGEKFDNQALLRTHILKGHKDKVAPVN